MSTSPDKSSAINSYSKSWFLIFWGSASGRSHLFIATTIGTLAAFACLIDSIVCGFTPSSAATTKITISVNFEPLARISVNAAWPGVSIKVILFFLCVIWYAPMCWVMPPNSPDTTLAFLKTSKTDVLPWSTWPITVTMGALLFRFCVLISLILSKISSAFSSLTGLCPNSLTKYSAVSASIVWLIVTVTPIPIKCLIILLDCSAILFANSLIVITSGMLISLFTGLKLSFVSSLFNNLFSFCFALFNEAKLLDLIPISSPLNARETVNLSSLLLPPCLLSLFSFWTFSPFNLLVSKSDLIGDEGLEMVVFFGINVLCDLLSTGLAPLEKFVLPPNLGDLFSITTVFFDWDLACSILLIVFLEAPEIDNFNFFFSIFHLSILIYNISCRHN